MKSNNRTGPLDRTRTLRAGVIGLGIGEAHAHAYVRHPSCTLAAVCDYSSHKTRRLCRTSPSIERASHATEILTDPSIDIVSVASYDDQHYEHLVQALENGKHVFVEKPLCLTLPEARHIRSILTSHPMLQLSSNLVLRKHPRFLALKHHIESGDFGRLFHVEGDYMYGRVHKLTHGWRGRRPTYSVVCGGLVHMVDLLMWLSACRITEVSAFGNRIASLHSRFSHNDMVVSALLFDDGMTGKAAVSYGCVRPHFHGLALYGTEATFVNDIAYGCLYLTRDPRQRPLILDEHHAPVSKGDLVYDFVDAIIHKRPHDISTDDVFRSISVCLAIEKAAATRKTCAVEYI